jgi:hypothetical protein
MLSVQNTVLAKYKRANIRPANSDQNSFANHTALSRLFSRQSKIVDYWVSSQLNAARPANKKAYTIRTWFS